MTRRGLRIGLLGGSFNPAHDGHRHVSLEALRRLALDEVWWLVSPQNPLKATKGMAPFARRFEHARGVACHPRIRVTDIEARVRTRYTVDTLVELGRRRPDDRFVWLMGADNLRQLPGWDRWTELMNLVPVAVFDREPYSWNVLTGQAATRFRCAYWRQSEARALADAKPPAWSFIRMRRHPMSATEARARGATPWHADNTC